MEKVTTSMEMMTIKASITTGTMTATFADGMTATKAIFRQDLPRETGCRQGWKDNLCGVASFRRGSRSDSNHVPRSWNVGYLRRLLIARTC